MLCTGCIPHLLDLLVEDIFKLDEVREHWDLAREIIKYFRNKSAISGAYRAAARRAAFSLVGSGHSREFFRLCSLQTGGTVILS